MTKKDGTINENTDRDKRTEEDLESHHTTTDRFPEDAKGIAETDVKNAHASGDGSIERGEKGFPDTSKDEAQKNESDPPY